MLRKFTIALAIVFVPMAAPVSARTKVAEQPQVIKLQRFRKALWKMHVTVKGKPGDFLFDTGGGNTLLTDDYLKGIDCEFWGRTTGLQHVR